MDKIPLAEYARNLGKAPNNATRLANRGSFESAQKIGRDWFVDPAEPWPDRRRKQATSK